MQIAPTPHERLLFGVFADSQISQASVQWDPFSGSAGLLEPMASDDSFHARLDEMIQMRHSLAVLASRMPWAQIEASLPRLFGRCSRPGCARNDADRLGPTSEPVDAGGSNAAGRAFRCG